MSGLEFYGYYVAPLILLATGLGMVAITKLLEWRERGTSEQTEKPRG